MKKVLIYFIAILFTSLLLYSCQKENIGEHDIDLSEKTENRSSTFPWPHSIDGRLAFRTYAEYLSTYSSLDSHLDSGGDGLSIRKFTNEGRPNRSYNPPIETVHNKLLNDYFVDPTVRYQPFLTDPVAMQLLNEHFEIQIEDVVITYINNAEVLITSVGNQRVINQIRALPKGNQYSPTELPDEAIWSSLDNLELEIENRSLCECSVNVEQTNCCEMRVFGNCRTLTGGAGDGTVRVRFIPGNTVLDLMLVERVNGNYEVIIPNLCDHPLYNPNGEDRIDLQVTADADCSNKQNNADGTLFANRSCDLSENDTGWEWESEGEFGLSHRTANYTGSLSKYEVAESYAKRWVVFNHPLFTFEGWVPFDVARLSASIRADRSNFFCHSVSSEQERNECFDCSHQKARVNIGLSPEPLSYCTGDVVGRFTMVFLDSPTSASFLVGEGIVEYNCCD